MNDGAAIFRSKPHVRVAAWLLLIVLTFMAQFLLWGLGWIISFLVADVVHALPLIGCVMVLVLVCWSPDRFGLKLGDHRKVWWVYLACGVVLAGYYALRWHIVPHQLLQTIGEHSQPSAYLLVPFSEELLFRGFMYSVLAELYPESETSRRFFSRAVMITAIFFGLWHWGWITAIGWFWGLAHMVLMVGVGLVFGYVRRRSGSVLGPFFMHAVGNYIVGL